MQKDIFLNHELAKLQNIGSQFTKQELLNLRNYVLKKLEYPYLEKAVEESLEKMIDETSAFLKTGAAIGISECVSFPGFYVNILGGESIHGRVIESNTQFDLASITKLYTTLLVFILEDRGFLHYEDQIRDVMPQYDHLYPYNIWDILCMHGEIRTQRRVAEANSKKEAEEILNSIYLYNEDKQIYTYTDMGLIILSKVIEKVMSQNLSMNMSYANIMKNFLLEPLNLSQTTFYPGKNIAGNGRSDFFVHDPKARILGGCVGSAGLFTTSRDLAKLADCLFFHRNGIHTEMVTLLHKKFQNRSKGIGGLYQKYPDLSKTYVPKEYSLHTFASEGSTGSVAIFDVQNHIHNNILIDSIIEETGKKRDNFKWEYNEYQKKITDITLELYLLHQYYREDYSYVLKL